MANMTAVASAGADQDRDPFAWLTGDNSLAVPMLPDLAQRVIAMTSDPDIMIAKLAALVAKDQVLASRVLGLANSAYSAPLQTVATVNDAIVRLGTAAVRNVVVTVSLTSKMQDPAVYGAKGRELFDHALGTAYMARVVAERTRVNADEAFLYGLMHDIGKLVILKLAYEHQRRAGRPIPADIVHQAVAERHAVMGAVALRRWHLPESVDDPVMFHHNYQSAPRFQREAAVCHLANRLSHRYGFGCAADAGDLEADEVLTFLGLDREWLEATDSRAPGLFSVARQAFG
jgi:putative nucleotidyltransferase with HDIG domain